MDFKKMIFFPVLAPREREMVLKMKMARVAASKITLMRLKLLLLSWKGNWAYSKEMQPAIVPLVRDVEGWRRQVGLPICNIGTSHSDTVSSSWDLKNSRADFFWRSHQLHLEAVMDAKHPTSEDCKMLTAEVPSLFLAVFGCVDTSLYVWKNEGAIICFGSHIFKNLMS